MKAGAAHIAFTAPSTTAVRNFYAAALTAGGRPNGAPGSRCSEDGHFNAAVLDFDGNSIEVVYRNGPDMRHDGTIIEHSRVITWTRTRTVTHSSSYYESRSSASSSSNASPIMTPQTESVASKAPSVTRSLSAPTVVPVPEAQSNSNNGSGTQHFLGTLLGAAAGAAVAYAFVRSEQDSARKEADFSAFMDAKNAVKTAAGFFAQAPSQPQPPQQVPDPQPAPVQPVETPAPAPLPLALPSPPLSVHRNDDDARSAYSSAPSRASQVPRTSVPRQIEAAPASYYSPSGFGAPTPELLAIEYAPAYSRAPSAAPSRLSSAHRSHTSPELLTIEKARSSVSTARPAESIASTAKPPRPSSKPQSVVSRAHSMAPSAVPSTLISSFVADRPDPEDESSVQSYHSARTKARSSHSSVSKHSSRREGREDSSSSSRREGRSSSPTESKAPPPKPPKPASKAASIVSSILGRNKSKDQEEDDDFIDDLDLDDFTEDDLDTVVPSDSISQIGDPSTRRRHRSHRHKSKKHDDAESSVSHRSKKEKSTDDNESSVSKSSKHSHRSERSHRSHRSHRNSADSADDEDSSRPHRSSRSSKSKPSLVSESSEASTIRPSGKKASRKDSLTQGQYDGLFDEVQYGTGGVHASRQVTPSMASAARKNPMRSMINFSHAQKVRNFEGSQAGLARD